MSGVLRTTHFFRECISGYLQFTALVETLTLLTKVSSTYHHCQTGGIKSFLQVML